MGDRVLACARAARNITNAREAPPKCRVPAKPRRQRKAVACDALPLRWPLSSLRSLSWYPLTRDRPQPAAAPIAQAIANTWLACISVM
jgi:hypothetical protein